MKCNEIVLPPELLALIEGGRWPKSKDDLQHQNIYPLFSKEAIHRLVPDEDQLVLFPPPFDTVKDFIDKWEFWNRPEAAIPGIDPNNTLLIGDFGLGVDTLLALDYQGALNPKVIRIRWYPDPKGNNKWDIISQNFGDFCRTIGLL